MSKALPTSREYLSKDGKREARYLPLQGSIYEDAGPKVRKGPVYVLRRTARTRRGFGTIIHMLVTFTPTKDAAHKSAMAWVRVTTKDR